MTWLDLTQAQAGLWFGHEVDGTAAFTTAEVVEFDHHVETEALQQALDQTYAEFEQLRTIFRAGPAGPQQRVRDVEPVKLVVHTVADPAEAQRVLDCLLADPLDINRGEVTRTALLHLADGTSWWFHAAHHVVMDGFGFQLFARRVADHLRGAARPIQAPGVTEIISQESELPDDSAAWNKKVAQFGSTSTIGGGTARPASAAVRARTDLSIELQTRLLAAAGALELPWTSVVTAAMSAYLSRLLPPDTEQVRVGVPFVNRTSPSLGTHKTARTVCTAMNVLPVASAPQQLTIAATSHAVHEELQWVSENPWTPQEELARAAERQHIGPLFGPQVNLLPFTLSLRVPGGTGSVRNLTAGPVDDMTWCVRGMPGRGQTIYLEVDVNPQLYSADSAAAHANRLAHWLDQWLTSDPGTLVADLSLLTDDEFRTVVADFNDTATEFETHTLAERFSAAVELYGDRPALRHNDESLSYRELAHHAAQLATRLGPQPGTVGVCVPRSLDLYVAVYAIILAGGCYVPLDPELPAARLSDMAADAQLSTVLTRSSIEYSWDKIKVIELDLLPSVSPTTNQPTSVTDAGSASLNDAAYILFTSGSTGRPKGVQVSHRAIDNRLAWMQDYFGLATSDLVLHKTPISFDVSVWELFWPLQVGACVFIAEPGGHRDPRYLAELFATEPITVAHFVPSMLRALLADETSVAQLTGHCVRQLVCSGEALATSLVADTVAAFGVSPVNLYGPTEAAIDVTCFDTHTEPGIDPVPIGRPIWNTRCYVLDHRDRPPPIGVPGHLHLAGVQLADGYVGRQDLTEAAFVPDPFVAGERMYRTGDRARWRSDGQLEYLGRIDHQVKIRGQRLEPGEIEAVLSTVDEVDDIVVVPRPGADGALSLVAFVVAASGTDNSAVIDSLRATAADRLTDAMMPSRFVVVDALPVTSSGKADRKTLAVQELPALDVAAESPQSLTEQQIGEAMSAVLGLPAGPTDDFFLAGGHSLAALQLAAQLTDLFDTEVRLADVFANPTGRQLAQFVVEPSEQTNPARSELGTVLVLREPTTGVAPVFALPPAGGLGWSYTGLLRQLPREHGLIALQAQGFTGQECDEPTSLTHWAEQFWADIEPLLDGPLHVVGWSVGGMVAHEIVRIAEQNGVEVGTVTLLDAYPSEQWHGLPAPTEADAIRGVLRGAGIEAATDMALDRTTAVKLLQESGSAMAALPAQAIEAGIGWVVTSTALVRRSEQGMINADVTFWRAAAPRAETWVDPLGWTKHLHGELTVLDVQATHGELVTEPAISQIGARLTADLARFGREGPQ